MVLPGLGERITHRTMAGKVSPTGHEPFTSIFEE